MTCPNLQTLDDMHSRHQRSFGDLKPENVITAGKKLVFIDWCSSKDAEQGDSCCAVLFQLMLQSNHGIIAPVTPACVPCQHWCRQPPSACQVNVPLITSKQQCYRPVTCPKHAHFLQTRVLIIGKIKPGRSGCVLGRCVSTQGCS